MSDMQEDTVTAMREEIKTFLRPFVQPTEKRKSRVYFTCHLLTSIKHRQTKLATILRNR